MVRFKGVGISLITDIAKSIVLCLLCISPAVLLIVTATIEGNVPGVGLERTWDIALLTLFLNRGVLQTANQYLNPQGILLFAQPTKKNLERHQHPSERFLLDPSEIFEISENLAGMEILHVDEGWRTSERHEAWLACKKII